MTLPSGTGGKGIVEAEVGRMELEGKEGEEVGGTETETVAEAEEVEGTRRDSFRMRGNGRDGIVGKS